jgi:hypothetical protein
LCASAIVFVASEILSKYIECKSFRIPPANFEKPDSLSTINYIGTSLFGSFRVAGWSGVSYVFLTLFLPIIPIGCYRVRKGMTTSVSRKKQETAYTIFGSEESSGLEILYIYLRYYSIAAFVGGVLGVIAGCSA